MTPEEAQRAIHDADDLRSNLPADCWRALETIAGMREEWGVDAYNPYAHSPQWGFATEEAAREWESTARGPGEAPATILHRYVTEPEEA